MPASINPSQRPLQSLLVELSPFSSGRVGELVKEENAHIDAGVSAYDQKFSAEAKLEESKGNISLADTYQVLALVVDFNFAPRNLRFPFQPLVQWEGSRSPVPDDFSEDQIARLDEAAIHVTDPELLARISDVVWVKLKRHESARRAIDAYLAAARDKRFDEFVRLGRLERAMRLCKQINATEKKEECRKVFDEFRQDAAFFDAQALNLLALAQTLKILDPKEIGDASRAAAMKFGDQDPFHAESLLGIAAAGYSAAGDKASASDCHRTAANFFRAAAENVDALAGVVFVERAIESQRRAGASRGELQELNLLLTRKGREAIPLMKRVEGPSADFAEGMKAAQKLIEGLSPMDALRAVASVFPILSYNEHRERVEKSIANYPLMHFVSTRSLSSQGRQYSRRPSFMSNDPEEKTLALEIEIASAMSLHYQAVTKFGLIPALSELAWTTNDLTLLFNFLSNRPIVPPEREQIFNAGIRAGLDGEFLYSSHVLIPQLENSLRHLLETRGLSVVALKDGLHSEMSLNQLFENYRNELGEILCSDDLAYTIEMFLCSRAGENFRNEIAHGLVPKALDYRHAFTWWLVVHLVFRFTFAEDENGT